MIAAASDFVEELAIPNRSTSPVKDGIEWYINKYEPKFLEMLFGVAGYQSLKTGLGQSNFALPTTIADAFYLKAGNGDIVKVALTPGENTTLTPTKVDAGSVSADLVTDVQASGFYLKDAVTGTIAQIELFVDNLGGYELDVVPVDDDAMPDFKWLALAERVKPMVLCYVYWYYRKGNYTTFTAAGETVITKSTNDNTVVVSPGQKMTAVWNEMVDLNRKFIRSFDGTQYGLAALPFNYFYQGLTYHNRYLPEIFEKINPIF